MAGDSQQQLQRLAQAVSFIRNEVNQDFAMTQFAIFLEVAKNPGSTYPDLGDALGMLQGSVSKNVKQLTKYYEKQPNGTKELGGYDLLRVEPDLEERRRLACFLTDRGKKLAKRLEAILNGEEN